MVMERWRPGRGLIPWRPFNGLEEMEQRLDDIFGSYNLATKDKSVH
jgi:hypothetical protein